MLHHLVRASSLILIALAGCAGPSDFRSASPRRLETIFSPLDHPAPNAYRTAAGTPGHAYWQQRADYVIEARLDEAPGGDGGRVEGIATITYTNNSPDELAYLWLHLEQNLFRPESAGARSTAPETRFGYRAGFSGGYDIRYVRAGPHELSLSIHDTLARLDLPAPIAPRGGQFVFDIAWSFDIPPFGADRMGIEKVRDGTIFQVAQWFPAVAVYDDVHGWNALPYLGQGEFYTNFGRYDVSITVPRAHIVAATGVLLNPHDVLTAMQLDRLQSVTGDRTVLIRSPEEVGDPASRPPGDGPLTWRYRADDVRTFAWASSPAFIWDAAWLEESGPDGRGTLVQSVYPREALPLWGQSTDMLRFAIEGYNRRWFTYPYPVAINVNGIVGGMEYPMISFCRNRRDEHGLYGVTTHEIGHNWFPMVVNTDEKRHAWMDEGLNSFINYYSLQERYPGHERSRRGDPRSFAPRMLEPDQQPVETPADQVLPGRLGTLQYAKPAVAMVLLRDYVLGPERFDPAFRRYIHEWAFKSPRPSDFFRIMNDAAGEDLSWFWRGWFLETGVLDQGVQSVRHDGERILATFVSRGELVMPLEFEVNYRDGSREVRRLPVEVWHATRRWTAEWPAEGRRVRRITLDPRAMLPDVNPRNNRWPR